MTIDRRMPAACEVSAIGDPGAVSDTANSSHQPFIATCITIGTQMLTRHSVRIGRQLFHAFRFTPGVPSPPDRERIKGNEYRWDTRRSNLHSTE
jgi:hypothetical protein